MNSFYVKKKFFWLWMELNNTCDNIWWSLSILVCHGKYSSLSFRLRLPSFKFMSLRIFFQWTISNQVSFLTIIETCTCFSIECGTTMLFTTLSTKWMKSLVYFLSWLLTLISWLIRSFLSLTALWIIIFVSLTLLLPTMLNLFATFLNYESIVYHF